MRLCRPLRGLVSIYAIRTQGLRPGLNAFARSARFPINRIPQPLCCRKLHVLSKCRTFGARMISFVDDPRPYGRGYLMKVLRTLRNAWFPILFIL